MALKVLVDGLFRIWHLYELAGSHTFLKSEVQAPAVVVSQDAFNP